MGYTFRVYDSIQKAPQEDWLSLRSGDGDLYMDPRFLRVVEESFEEPVRFWSVLIHDEQGRPAGSASLSLFPLDAALLCPPQPRRVLQAIRRVWRGCLHFPLLFCGLPVSAGQNHLRMAAGADRTEVLRQLDAALMQVAAEVPCVAVVCKEFTDAEQTEMDTLEMLGYVRGPSLPMNSFPARFESFDAFCAALRSHYRYKIHRSQRKFSGAGFRFEHFCGAAAVPHYTDEVHRLYLAVWERAEVKVELLPAKFFRLLAQRCGEAVRFNAVYQGAQIVAFSWGLFLGDSYQNLFVGIDYSLNVEYDLYFNLMAHDLEHALGLGARDIQMGQTTDTFKSRLGCVSDARHVYAKGARWYSARPLRLTHRLLMPPPPTAPVRGLFRNDAETREESSRGGAETRRTSGARLAGCGRRRGGGCPESGPQ